MLKNYSRVRLLTDDYKNEGISRGAVGYIIEIFNDGIYEAEFSDPDGTTAALLALKESELELADLSGIMPRTDCPHDLIYNISH